MIKLSNARIVGLASCLAAGSTAAWVACNGSNCLVRFDPESETFQSWPIPSGGVYAGIVRHMRPTHDGDLLIHQSATNRIIRVEIGD